jgi:hypothetical protein
MGPPIRGSGWRAPPTLNARWLPFGVAARTGAADSRHPQDMTVEACHAHDLFSGASEHNSRCHAEGFGLILPGNAPDMSTHIPRKRQSLKPTRAVWMGLAALLIVLLAIWLVVGFASRGPSQCPAGKSSTSNCG